MLHLVDGVIKLLNMLHLVDGVINTLMSLFRWVFILGVFKAKTLWKIQCGEL